MTKILSNAVASLESRTAEVNKDRPTRAQPLRMIAFVDQAKN